MTNTPEDPTRQEIRSFFQTDASRQVTLLLNKYRSLANDCIDRCRELGDDVADWAISVAKKDGMLEHYGIPILQSTQDWWACMRGEPLPVSSKQSAEENTCEEERRETTDGP